MCPMPTSPFYCFQTLFVALTLGLPPTCWHSKQSTKCRCPFGSVQSLCDQYSGQESHVRTPGSLVLLAGRWQYLFERACASQRVAYDL